MKNINETVNGAAVDIASTDYPVKKLTIQQIYKQLSIPSLGREIFPVYKQNGPLAGIFALQKDNNKIKLLRNDSQVYDSDPINTGISAEAAQDIQSHFGEGADSIIAHLLRGLANEQENTKTSEFLDTNANVVDPITLSDKKNSRIIVEEITQAVVESVAEMNSPNYITYKASVVIPMKYAGSFMIRGFALKEGHTFYMGTIGHNKFYIDPNPLNTDTVYVILKDEDRSGGFFSEYTDDIITAVDNMGDESMFIFNRFAITTNPKHDIKPMIHSFKVQEGLTPLPEIGYTKAEIDYIAHQLTLIGSGDLVIPDDYKPETI